MFSMANALFFLLEMSDWDPCFCSLLCSVTRVIRIPDIKVWCIHEFPCIVLFNY